MPYLVEMIAGVEVDGKRQSYHFVVDFTHVTNHETLAYSGCGSLEDFVMQEVLPSTHELTDVVETQRMLSHYDGKVFKAPLYREEYCVTVLTTADNTSKTVIVKGETRDNYATDEELLDEMMLASLIMRLLVSRLIARKHHYSDV